MRRLQANVVPRTVPPKKLCAVPMTQRKGSQGIVSRKNGRTRHSRIGDKGVEAEVCTLETRQKRLREPLMSNNKWLRNLIHLRVWYPPFQFALQNLMAFVVCCVAHFCSGGPGQPRARSVAHQGQQFPQQKLDAWMTPKLPE